MHIFSNLEYSFIIKELAPLLVGKHFSRIRKLAESTYRMKVGSVEIICELSVRLHATKYIEQNEDTDKFVEKVNKELDNARLISIEQINNDRIVSFNFDNARLIFEMFGDGNAILVRDNKTVTAHKFESWSGREIKAGSEYKPPKITPSEKLEVSDKYIAVSLMKLPVGKDYIIEALARTNIDEKTPGKELDQGQLAAINRVISEIKSGAKPIAFFDSERLVDFSLAKLSRYQHLEAKEFMSLSEVADEYYHHAEKPNPKLEKLLDRLEKQKERKDTLLQEEKEHRLKGDYIYEHYDEVNSIIQLAKATKFDEIEKKYKGKIDKKEKTVEIELQT